MTEERGRPSHILHRDEGPAVSLSDLVDRADVRMVETGESPCFAEKPVAGRLIVQRVRMEQLQGHFTFEHRIVGAVDDTHPAGPEGVKRCGSDPVTRRSSRAFGVLDLRSCGNGSLERHAEHHLRQAHEPGLHANLTEGRAAVEADVGTSLSSNATPEGLVPKSTAWIPDARQGTSSAPLRCRVLLRETVNRPESPDERGGGAG